MGTAELPATAEVVIVGGGVMGCALAFHLTQRGVRPLLLERDRLGAGSTGRCAGGIRQQFSTVVNIRLARRSFELLARFPEEVGADPAYRPIGYLLLATTPDRAAQLEAAIARQRAEGVAVERLDGPAAAERVPGLRTDDVLCASWCPTDGLAGPSEVTLGYAGAARRRRAVLAEDTAVTGIRLRGDAVTGVVTTRGAVASGCVVICAGPQARAVGGLAGVTVPVDPVRRQAFVTGPFPGQPPRAPMTVDLDTSFYLHQEGPGLMIGMGNPEEPVGEDCSVDWGFLPELVAAATLRLPALAGAEIRRGWAGLYEMTPDRQPLVGPVPERRGLWLACGFSGHGFMLGPSVGEGLAAWLTGGRPPVDLAAFTPERFDVGRAAPETLVI